MFGKEKVGTIINLLLKNLRALLFQELLLPNIGKEGHIHRIIESRSNVLYHLLNKFV